MTWLVPFVSAKMIGLPPVFWHEKGMGGGVIQASIKLSMGRGNSHFSGRYPFYLCTQMHSPRVYFNNIGPVCTDSLRNGNGLSALQKVARQKSVRQNKLHGKRALCCGISAI